MCNQGFTETCTHCEISVFLATKLPVHVFNTCVLFVRLDTNLKTEQRKNTQVVMFSRVLPRTVKAVFLLPGYLLLFVGVCFACFAVYLPACMIVPARQLTNISHIVSCLGILVLYVLLGKKSTELTNVFSQIYTSICFGRVKIILVPINQIHVNQGQIFFYWMTTF